jgi:arabinofuranosyltransferase
VLVITIALFTILTFVCAWQSDDAFITWRTAENAANGYGLRWNIDERVQSYSNPLWMLLGLSLRLVTGEFYYSMLFASIGLSIGSLLFVFHLTRHVPYLTFVIFWAFMCSNAFMDFSVSGLENPLLGFLILWRKNPCRPLRYSTPLPVYN